MLNIDVNGEQLEYQKQGDGFPILLLHGVGACAGLSAAVLRSLAAKYAAYAVSLRGHGGSSCNGAFSVDAMVDDIGAFAEKLGLASFHVVGVSLGGAVALHLAAVAPKVVRSAVVCGLGLTPSQALADEVYGIREAQHYLAPDAFAQQVAEAMLVPDTPDGEREALSRSILKLGKKRYLQALEALSSVQLTDVAKQVQAPVLVMRGEMDELVSDIDADALATALGGAARAEIAEAGHLADIDNPSLFTDQLNSFFDRI